MRKAGVFLLVSLLLAACSSRAAGPNQPGSETPSPGPLPWAGLGLTGRLVFIHFQEKGNALESLDLDTGKTTILFQAPQNAWLAAAAVSPDGKQIAMAYAPPPEENQTQFGYTDLDWMPAGSSSPPRPLLQRKGTEESFFTPTWSPDGKYIYYSHFVRSDAESVPTYKYTLNRTTTGGASELILEDAIWPAFSPNGTKLAYLSFNMSSSGNELYLAAADGSHSQPAIAPGKYPAVDAHLFTLDGNSILFSAVNAQVSPASSWLEKLMGVQVASAHNVPSDWYRLDLASGETRRLTHLNETGMNAVFSPDGKHLAYICSTGLYVMDGEGQNVVQVSSKVVVGTIDWIP